MSEIKGKEGANLRKQQLVAGHVALSQEQPPIFLHCGEIKFDSTPACGEVGLGEGVELRDRAGKALCVLHGLP